MGVSTNVYTVYGVQMPWDDGFAEAYDNLYGADKAKALEAHVILDGMGGDYMVIGDVLFDSGDSRWEPMSGFETIDPASIDKCKQDIIDKFAAVMPEFTALRDRPWQLMTFVHYH